MAANELRYGIVGCAGMGTIHADAVTKTEEATLVACADISEDNARAFGEEYGTDWYTDHTEMVAGADVDAVSICTPNGTHAEIVEDLAECGVDILCEKPLEITLERTNRVIDACEREGSVLGCVFQRRTMGGARLAHEAVSEGRLGEPILADVQVKWHREQSYFDAAGWRGTQDLDGGVLLTQALHGVDLLQWVMGGVERICASIDTLHQDVAVPDTAVASVEFSNGALGQITASTAVYPERPITLQVHGTEGTIRWHEDGIDAYETVSDHAVDPEPFHLGVGILGQVRDFVTAVHNGTFPMVPPEEARKAHDIVFAAEASAERGEWVDVASFRNEHS